MSIIDAAELPDGHRLRADVCIIGGGPAGITVALGLQGRGIDVVLLEGGGMDYEEEVQSLYRGETAGVHYYDLDETRLRMLGGSSNHWEGYCRPLDPEDFEGSDGDPGWPFGYDELDQHYRRAQELCQLPAFDYDPASWSAKLGATLVDLDGSPARNDIVHRGPPVRFGVAYEDQLASSDTTTVLLHANAVELVAEGDRVASVRVAHLDGRTAHVEAVQVVLATGGIENARLLLSSDQGRPGGIGNGNDLVGRLFMEHLHVDRGRLLLPQGHELGLYVDGAPVDGATVHGMFTLEPEARRSLGIGNIGVMILPAFGPLASDHGSEAARMVARDVVGIGEPDTDVRLQVLSEQHPNLRSRVELIPARDALGMRRCRLTWDLLDRDLQTLRAGVELIADQLGAAGLGPVRSPWHDDLTDAALHGGHHHLGTTRMHEDPAQGVVDATCRVHEVENLYVAGSSVFTTAGFANPTLTLVALADRLAAHLRDGG